MRANRARDTAPELSLRRSLRAEGYVGYRVAWRVGRTRPDIVFVGKRVAIFVHGCFWHRCPECRLQLPRSNREFWKAKFRSNRGRDRRKRTELELAGWRVLEIFECWLKAHPLKLPLALRRVLEQGHAAR